MGIKIKVNMAKVAIMGKTEIGLAIPITGKAKLATTPENIIKARLNPTEYSRLSIKPIL